MFFYNFISLPLVFSLPAYLLLLSLPRITNTYLMPVPIPKQLTNWKFSWLHVFNLLAPNHAPTLLLVMKLICLKHNCWLSPGCNKTYYGDIGRTYEVELHRPREDLVPYVCLLTITAPGGVHGDLVQVSSNMMILSDRFWSRRPFYKLCCHWWARMWL